MHLPQKKDLPDKSVSSELWEQKALDIKLSLDQKKVYFSGKVSVHICTQKEDGSIVFSAKKIVLWLMMKVILMR